MSDQQLTPPSSSPHGNTGIPYTQAFQPAEPQSVEPEPSGPLHGYGRASSAGEQVVTSPDDLDWLALENINFFPQDVAEITMLYQEFISRLPITNFPTYEPEGRRICAMVALGQFDIPLEKVPKFETRADAELWLASKPPLIITLPRLKDADYNTVMGAAVGDVTQMLAEINYISIKHNTPSVSLQSAAQQRYRAANIAKEYLARAIMDCVRGPVRHELADNKEIVLAALLYIPPSDRRIWCRALREQMDKAEERLMLSLKAMSDELIGQIMADLNDPTSSLVRGLPDCGTQHGARETPLFVRIYMDRVWGTSMQMVEGCVMHYVNQMGRAWIDEMYDAAEPEGSMQEGGEKEMEAEDMAQGREERAGTQREGGGDSKPTQSARPSNKVFAIDRAGSVIMKDG